MSDLAPPSSRRFEIESREASRAVIERQRQQRHYLVDPRFQLKYTFQLIGVVLTVILLLGSVIWNLGNTAASIAESSVIQAEKALKESQANSRLVQLNAINDAGDNPELIATIEDQLKEEDKKAALNLEEVQSRGRSVKQTRDKLFYVLTGACVSLAVLLFLMGVFITNRIVGPVFRIKRLLRQVGTGRLVIHERLRRGDELEDLFETFLQMTVSLRVLHINHMSSIDSVIRKLELSNVSEESLIQLRRLRIQMELMIVDSTKLD